MLKRISIVFGIILTLLIVLPYALVVSGVSFEHTFYRQSPNPPLQTFVGRIPTSASKFFDVSATVRKREIVITPRYNKKLTISSGATKLISIRSLFDSGKYQISSPGYYIEEGQEKPYIEITLYNRDGSIINQTNLKGKDYSSFGYKNGAWQFFNNRDLNILDNEERKSRFDYFISIGAIPQVFFMKYDMLKELPQKYLGFEDYYPWVLSFETDESTYNIKVSTFKNPGNFIIYPTR